MVRRGGEGKVKVKVRQGGQGVLWTITGSSDRADSTSVSMAWLDDNDPEPKKNARAAPGV